jgi:hypothetical protein
MDAVLPLWWFSYSISATNTNTNTAYTTASAYTNSFAITAGYVCRRGCCGLPCWRVVCRQSMLLRFEHLPISEQ